MRFIWKNLPVFLIWLIGLSVLNNSLHHIAPPLNDILWLSLFPLAASLILLFFALKKDDGRGIMKRYLRWAGLMSVLYFTPVMHSLSLPIDLEKQRVMYEISAFMEFVIIVLHARTWFKKWDWVWVFGITLLFGMILENGGIIIGFFVEEGFRLYAPGLPAPLATALGWVNVMYCAFFAVQRLLPVSHPVARGLVCAFIGLSMDIPFDPVATKLGWWLWNPVLDKYIFGVPVINYVSWFWAIFPYGTIYYWFRGREDIAEGKRIGYLVGIIPLILVVETIGIIGCLILIGDTKALLIFKSYFTSLGFH